MKPYQELSREELEALEEKLQKEYDAFKERGLKLDMSRGKPSKEQLDLSMGMMDVLSSGVNLVGEEGVDCRNYGVLDGIKEAQELLGAISEVSADKMCRCLSSGFCGLGSRSRICAFFRSGTSG